MKEPTYEEVRDEMLRGPNPAAGNTPEENYGQGAPLSPGGRLAAGMAEARERLTEAR